MFANPQIKTRGTRTGATCAAAKRLNDENARAGARGKLVKDKDGGDCDAAPAITKKRAALGDVSNVHLSRPTQQAGTKPAALAVQQRVTRSMAANAKTRKPAVTAETAAAKSKTAAAAAAAVLRASKKTQAAIEAVAAESRTESRATSHSDSRADVSEPTTESSTDPPDAVDAPAKSKVVAKSRPIKEAKDSVFTEVPKVQQHRTTVKTVATKVTVSTTVAAPKPTKVQAFEEEDSQERLHMSKRIKTDEWDDLDAEDATDPLMVSEYVNEIFEYMRELEMQTMPNPGYMDLQKELQWKMRSILVDWLIEVHHKFHLLAETLYLTVNIVDRFLSLRVVSLVKLQLVGVTAMFIAAKYEEVVAPSIQNFLYMADGGYTDDEVLRAERYILQVLDFSLQYPSPMSFLRRCSKADQYDIQTRTLAKYLMEVSLVDHRFLKMPPSLISAAGLYLSRHMLSRGPWNANLVHYSGYEESELIECAQAVLDYLSKPTKYEALYKKYSARKFMKAAIFVEDWIAKQNGNFALPSISAVSSKSSSSSSSEKTDSVRTASQSSRTNGTMHDKVVKKDQVELESDPEPQDDAESTA